MNDLVFLAELAYCNLDGRKERPLADRFHYISENHGFFCLFDDVFIAKSCQEYNGCQIVMGNHFSCLDTVKPGHLNIKDYKIRIELLCQFQSFNPVGSYTDDFMACFFHHFLKIHADECFIICDYDFIHFCYAPINALEQ